MSLTTVTTHCDLLLVLRTGVYDDQCVEELAPEKKKNRLILLCETRWVERHDAIFTFVELLPCVIACLEKCKLLDAITGSKAQMFLRSICSTEFIVAVAVLESVLSVTLSLSKSLQTVGIDLIQALQQIKVVEKLLTSKRDNADVAFLKFGNSSQSWQKKQTLS